MNYAGLIKAINSATTQLQGRAAAPVNQALVLRNWMVGAWIVEFEQTGKDRAKYGARPDSGDGVPEFKKQESAIRGPATSKLPTPLSSPLLLRLSWSQLQEPVGLDDPWKRAFFENECLKGHWSVRQHRRQES